MPDGSLQDATLTARRSVDRLVVIYDVEFRSAPLNMAIDEALLETSTLALLRFYRWDHPAVSFGYFGRFADLARYHERDLVRRWTGGGIVFHGDDLTYALIIPAADSLFRQSAAAIYETTHRALQRALSDCGINAALASVAPVSDGGRNRPDPAVRDRRSNPD